MKLDQRQARRVLLAVRTYAMDEIGDIKKLQGSDEWRLRTGDWRIGILLPGSSLYVVQVKNRRDAYEHR